LKRFVDVPSTMTRRSIVVGATLLLLIGGGLALTVGDGTFTESSGPESAESTEPFPTATPPSTAAGSGGSGGSSATATATPRPSFAFEVRSIESCGQTCRDVTSTVSNGGDAQATDVAVYSRIFVGNSTDTDDLAWQGDERVGTLGAGETYTATKTVELSYPEALAVRSAGDWVTVQTTVESDQRTVTFTRRRNVT
jgi:hypothetical protein